MECAVSSAESNTMEDYTLSWEADVEPLAGSSYSPDIHTWRSRFE